MKLPGERELYPGEPDVRLRQLGGPVTLESFRLIHTDDLSWHRDLPVVFTIELLGRSQARRIKAGQSKLLFDAARETLKTFERELHRMYAKRGWLSYLPDELADKLAMQLADDVKSDRLVKVEVANTLNGMRDWIATDDRFASMPNHVRELGELEGMELSFVRWIDYFEYAKTIDGYSNVLRLHRFVVSCARIHDAVFGTFILQPNGA